jgi:hypothetical protein
VDLTLLVGSGRLDKQRILDTLLLTFERRGTHGLPTSLAPPPADWQITFQALAEECRLPTDVAAAFAGVQVYFEELLAQRQSGECGMTDSGSDSLPFEPPEQENIRLRE